jgi:putative ABC transport system substrate-binding protein
MRRREFIAGLGSAVAWPAVARAQHPERIRRIGVLFSAPADNAEFQARVGAFLQGLALLGWSIGRNVWIDTRWATANPVEIRRHVAELVALAPDVILANGGATVDQLLQATRTMPIAFAGVADPVGAGFTRVTPGAICLRSSSHFPAMLNSADMKPVALPPGRAKLSTSGPPDF